MSGAGHTAGPFGVEDTGSQDKRIVITAKHPFSDTAPLHLATGIERIEDAHLFAAAPELLEAVSELMDALLVYDGWAIDPTDPSGWNDDTSHDAFMLARAAIARARGR